MEAVQKIVPSPKPRQVKNWIIMSDTKFKKGDKRINRSGRPAGKPNRTTEAMRAVIGDIINENLPRIREAIKEMPDKEAIVFIERLLRHYLPAPVQDISQFSDDDLDLLIEKLKQKYNNHEKIREN